MFRCWRGAYAWWFGGLVRFVWLKRAFWCSKFGNHHVVFRTWGAVNDMNEVMMIPYQKPTYENGRINGNIEILDPQYGNIWTNIDRATFEKLGLKPGDQITIKIANGDDVILEQTLPYFHSFGRVEVGEPLLYLNSLNNVALAVNQGNYSETFQVLSGASWSIEVVK